MTKGKVQELQAALLQCSKDSKLGKKKEIVKKIIANMTMGSNMIALSTQMIEMLPIADLELKKMIYLYVVTYAPSQPTLADSVFPILKDDCRDDNSLIRTLSLRTMSNINVPSGLKEIKEPLLKAIEDKDPYVCKTAAICIAKMYRANSKLAEADGYLEQLMRLLSHENPTVSN